MFALHRDGDVRLLLEFDERDIQGISRRRRRIEDILAIGAVYSNTVIGSPRRSIGEWCRCSDACPVG